MEQDILTKFFAEELGEDYETINQYYEIFIEKIEEPDDIKEFAETITEYLKKKPLPPGFDTQTIFFDDGFNSEDERTKYHYAWMFNSMTIAWKRMLKHQIKEGEEKEESFDEYELDETKGLVSNVHYERSPKFDTKEDKEDIKKIVQRVVESREQEDKWKKSQGKN